MDVRLVIGLSILLQFTAAAFSLRLIRVTKGRRAWILISAAIFLMGIRRLIIFFRSFSEDLSHTYDLPYEVVGLAASALMLAGVAWIAPLFISVNRSKEELIEKQKDMETTALDLMQHRDYLNVLIAERTTELKTLNKELAEEIRDRTLTGNVLEESLSEYQRLTMEFYTLLYTIPDTLAMLSPELKILWTNRGTAYGVVNEISVLAGKYCYELWQGRSKPCDDCPALKSFNSGKPANSHVLTPDRRVLESRAFPIMNETGRVRSAIIVASDITEKLALQAEAVRASHLASLGELAAGVAHEINNPINGIINYAQILANRLSKESSENGIANRIIKEGSRITNIVQGLLLFARKREEGKNSVKVSAIVEDSLLLTRAQITKDNIRLDINVPNDLPEIIANPQQIQQVFLNIISNARYALNQKYPKAHEDKVFTITGEDITIDERPYVRITFHDRGTGIPADIKDKVMNPFFSTKPSGIGTGLGLSISHGIVRNHGGRLIIESVEGKFTRVIIDLPAQVQSSAPMPESGEGNEERKT